MDYDALLENGLWCIMGYVAPIWMVTPIVPCICIRIMDMSNPGLCSL